MLNQVSPPYTWLDPLVSRCQRMAGAELDSDDGPSIDELREMLALLPLIATRPERLAIRSLFNRVLGHFTTEWDERRGVSLHDAFVAWASTEALSDRWRTDLFDVVEAWTAILNKRSADSSVNVPAIVDVRVRRAIDMIDAGYTNPDLKARDIASAVELSVSRLSHLLTSKTGHGFVAHVHARWIDRARGLLAETADPIKEIAIDVGYTSASEFGRHFRRASGMTPRAFRGACTSIQQGACAKSDDK